MSEFIAFIKTFSILVGLVDKFYEVWIDSKIDKSRGHLLDYNNKRKVILQQIQKAENDEERIVLSAVLHDLNINKL